MKRDDISTDAKNVLADYYVFKYDAKKYGRKIVDELNMLIESFDYEETKKYMEALKELKKKHYIMIYGKPECTEYWRKRFMFTRTTIKGRYYFWKFLHQEYGYEVKEKEERTPLSAADKALIKFSNSGVFILITVILTAIASLIDTALNIYNTFHR